MIPDLDEKKYVPGEDVSGMEEDVSERRREIEELFAKVDE